ncbi:Complement decay-accelerating factor, partial [Podiceps cristatus]
GYIPLGATTIRCLGSGRWHPRVPSCILGHCPYPPAVDHAERILQHEFPVGTTVTYFCRTGYTLIPEVSPIATCLKNFTWSIIPKLCQKMKCPSPAIRHGREISPRKAEYTFGHQVELQCEPGYVLRGSQRIQCWSDGTWRPPVPYCDKVCGPPPKITNGQHSGLRTEQFPYGSQVKYSCAEGLSLVGDDSIYCTSDDGVNMTWSGPAPECRGGSFLLDGIGVKPGPGCNISAQHHGNKSKQGCWEIPLHLQAASQPRQRRTGDDLLLCPQPQVANGRLKSTLDGKMWYQTNATVTFECFHGYHFSDDGDTDLQGSWTATCLPDGNWTPLPKCQKEGDADVCEEVRYIKMGFECSMPITEVKTLLEIQKLFLEIKKLKMELENLYK